MGRARFDANNNHSLIAVSNLDGSTPIELWADPSTHGLVLSASITGGGDGAILDGVTNSIKGTVFNYTNSHPIAARLTDTNGDYVSVGGGTQYVTGAAQATPTGTTALGWDGANVQALKTTSGGNLILGAGAAVIGHVITDTGSTTVVTGSVAVTGTFWQATQPVSGTFWQATQPVSGTVTANIGTSGSLALDASVTGLQVSQGTALGSTKVILTGGSVTTAAPTFTTGQINQLSLTTSGALRVDLGATSANATAIKVDGSAVTQPVSGTVSITANSAVNLAQINAVTPLMGNGLTGTGSLRVTIASDNTAFAVNSTLSAETTKVIGVVRTSDGAGNLLTSNSTTYTAKFAHDGNLLGTLGTAFSTAGKVDVKGADGDVFVRQATGSNLHVVTDSGTITTVSTVTNLSQLGGTAIAMNTGTRSAGTQRVTIATDDVVPASQSGTWTVQPGNTPNTSPWLTTQTPKTSGGLTTFHLVAAASTNATNIKASAGQVFGWFIYNSNAAARKVVFHNNAGTPTAGASVFFAIVIPPSAGANVEFTNGIAFSTGIAITTVTDLTDAGATAVAANDLIINIFYS